ncbi:MAG: NAD(P)H-dependent oxidoreductase [Bacteroidetes bacterium]|nr:NAD(P)H-dependent oxidoreductase [Bacteroidota bacterium]
MIKIVTILGTIRPGNYTGKALAIIENEIEQHDDFQLISIDPREFKLSIPGSNIDGSDSKHLQTLIEECTGLVISTPEYHGSYSSLIKMVIENLGFPSTLSAKPVALLGVAAGQIGAIKALEHLRSVLSHVGAIVLPGPVSIANVQAVFDKEGNCLDDKVEKRLRGSATGLMDYIRGSICPKIALEAMVRE